MKKTGKVILVSILIMFIICPLLSFASGNTNNTSEDFYKFYDSLNELIYQYDSQIVECASFEEEEECIDTYRLIVKTNSNESIVDDRGAVSKVEGWNCLHILQYSCAQDANTAYLYFENQNNVEYVNNDWVVLQNTDVSEATSINDVYVSPLSWGNAVVKSDIAKERISQSSAVVSEVVVAVFDTGLVSTHPFFDPNRILDGHSIYNTSLPATDQRGHGTHVAGIVYDNTSPNVKIKPYKTDAPGRTYSVNTSISSFGSAIVEAVNSGVDVINMSLTSDYLECDYIEESIKYAYDNNVPIVVAAGNDLTGDGKDAIYEYPAKSTYVLTVAAIDEELTPMLKSKNGAGSTNYGDCVDIAAPGEEITSTFLLNGFASDSGTSMAAHLLQQLLQH